MLCCTSVLWSPVGLWESCSMLCCTSLLSSVLRSAALGLRRSVLCLLRSMAQGLGELLYAVLQICALVPSWALGELLYAVLHICAVSVL